MHLHEQDRRYIQDRTGYATKAMDNLNIPTQGQRTILAQEIGLALQAERDRCLGVVEHYEMGYSHIKTGHLFAKLRSGVTGDGVWPFEGERTASTPADRPTVVCLCGSTRFSEAFQAANLRETLAGKIVLSIGCDMKSDGDLFGTLPPEDLADIKQRLDELHLRKIDMADEVLILNVGGYVGESTRRELAYAQQQGKVIRWLEQPTAD